MKCASARQPRNCRSRYGGDQGADVYRVGVARDGRAQYLSYVNLNILGLLAVVAGIAGIVFARRCLPKVSDALHAKIYVLLLIAVLIAICHSETEKGGWMPYKGAHQRWYSPAASAGTTNSSTSITLLHRSAIAGDLLLTCCRTALHASSAITDNDVAVFQRGAG